MPHALLVDDDFDSVSALGEWMESQGFTSRPALNLQEARTGLADRAPDLVLVDLQLPDGTGLQLLDELRELPETEVVFMTGHASIDTAVAAMQGGAVDYLTKPVDPIRLRKILADVRAKIELRQEIGQLRGELRSLGRFGSIVGASPPMQDVFDEIERVAPTDATVLLSGETGTGKEVAARTIHRFSRRGAEKFLPVNCGAVAPSLIESEVFGHERGSFTGATNRHAGMFERADGGTLFLDEITEMSPELQVKLLRVLETGEVTRIGSHGAIKVSVRVIAATNRDPQSAVREGRLREDLLYRLMVFPIVIPPLRKRGHDVMLLAQAFLDALNEKHGAEKSFDAVASNALVQHTWPGNVRELRNVVERAFILSRDDTIRAISIPLPTSALPTPGSAADTENGVISLPLGITLADAERRLIMATLEHFQNAKRKAAAALGVSVKTIYNRLKAYESESHEAVDPDLVEDPAVHGRESV